jgi:acetylornithine deacetylase/succinyl-diaminopimelate desuccinylase-like protein
VLAEIVELARIPAPTFSEEERLVWIERRLAETPGRHGRDSAGNVIWSWGHGSPRLLVLAHVDTVFSLQTPLRFEENDGFLVGPGIGDNAAAVVVAIHAVEDLLAEGTPAPGAVAFTVGEEGLGNLKGALVACRELAPEAVIALEGHDLDKVIVDAVGSVRAAVRIIGPGGHSWADRGSPSAIDALFTVGARLTELRTPATPVNIGLVSGGRSVNAIADAATLTAEMRALAEPPLRRFEDALAGIMLEPPLRVSVEMLGRRPAGRLDPSHPLLAAVKEVRAALGLPTVLAAGSTDANAALALGIPALALGVSFGSGMHSPAERIERGSVALGRAQLLGVLRRLLA